MNLYALALFLFVGIPLLALTFATTLVLNWIGRVRRRRHW